LLPSSLLLPNGFMLPSIVPNPEEVSAGAGAGFAFGLLRFATFFLAADFFAATFFLAGLRLALLVFFLATLLLALTLRAGALFADFLALLLDLDFFAFFAMVFLLLALWFGASLDFGYLCRGGRQTLPQIAAINRRP
jgi:hypothetical protein